MKKHRKMILIICISVIATSVIAVILYYVSIISNSAPVEIVSVLNCSTSYYDNSTLNVNVTSDFIQQVYPDGTKIIDKIYVSQGDTVKKGDKLIEYDPTKLELEYESAQLDTKKKENEINKIQAELQKLYNTTPYVEPVYTPEPTPTPIPERKAILYSVIDIDSVPFTGTGTSDDPYKFLCTSDCTVTSAFIQKLMGLETPSPSPLPTPSPSPSSIPSSEISENSDTSSMESSSASSSESSMQLGGESQLVSDASVPSELIQIKSKAFAAQFDVYDQDNDNSYMMYGWILDGTSNNGALLPAMIPINSSIAEMDNVGATLTYADTGENYTQDELNKLIAEKKQELTQSQYDLKALSLSEKKALFSLNNATLISAADGIVTSLKDVETAEKDGTAFLVISATKGVYVTGYLPENLLTTIKPGALINATCWDTGALYSGEIINISKYPVDESESYGQNPQISNYKFSAYLDNADDLNSSSGLSISFPEAGSDDALYILKAYIRSDENGKYVYIKGEGSKIIKKYITTGKMIYNGEYIEIKEGLTVDDYIAFPYGKNVKEGAPVEEKDTVANGGVIF